MMWKGVVIAESLDNRDILDLVKIVDTKQTILEKEDEKGILYFHKIELDDEKKRQIRSKR